MRLPGRLVRTRGVFGIAVAAISFLGLVSSGPATSADEGGIALALGDSVTFGYIAGAGHAYGNADNFVGFPEHYGLKLHMAVANAGCPGETSGSLIVSSPADNGCYAFRHFLGAPLHVQYAGNQLDYATNFIRNHDNVRLVTLLIGANDGFLLERQCASQPVPALCVQNGLGAVLASVAANIGTIIDAIRGAGFEGQFVLLTYYSLDYADAAQTGFSQVLNNAITGEAAVKHVEVADAFTAFSTRAALFAGHTCSEALLNPTPSSIAAVQLTCDVHPSQSGADLLATTVANTFRAHQENDQ